MADLSAIKKELALEWARIGPFATCELLGLQYRKEQRAAFICCPWHNDKTPSCTVAIGPEGTTRVHCFACQQSWDVHALFAQVHGLELHGSAFKDLLIREAETLTCWDIVEALEGKRPGPRPVSPPTPPRNEIQPEVERPLPDRDEVIDFIASCENVTEDESVALYLRTRHIDPQAVSERRLAYALPDNVKHLPEWARFRGSTWAELGHWLIIPVYNHLGMVVSVRAGRVIPGESPNRLPPAGCRVRGTIMADAMAQEMLKAGSWPDWATTSPGVVILEGEPDWLSDAQRTPLHTCPDRAVLGIYSGSWCEQIAKRIPDGAKVAIWTDHDQAGDKYAQIIGASLHKRCTVLRGK